MKNTLTTPDVYAILNREVNRAGTAKAFAAKNGLTEGFLSSVRNGAKPLPRNDSPLTRALGIEWVKPTDGHWRFRENI